MAIKDYIYLDEDSLNSSLAQFERGLIDSYSSESKTKQSNTNGQSTELSGGFNGFFGLGISGIKHSKTTVEETSADSQKEIINSIIHDYAVDRLIDRCIENHLLNKSVKSSNEGDFILLITDFHIYDFEYLEDIMSESNLELFRKLSLPDDIRKKQVSLNALRKKSSNRDGNFKAQVKSMQDKIDQANMKNEVIFDILNTIHLLGKFAKSAFNDSILVRGDNSIFLCKKQKFRMNRSQLAMLNDSKRKISVLGIVEAVKYNINTLGSFDKINPNEINKIPSMLSEVLLSSFNIIENNDRLIKPIAIYFE